MSFTFRPGLSWRCIVLYTNNIPGQAVVVQPWSWILFVMKQDQLPLVITPSVFVSEELLIDLCLEPGENWLRQSPSSTRRLHKWRQNDFRTRSLGA